MSKRPNIERLSEDTWARVKRNVFAALDAEAARRPLRAARRKRHNWGTPLVAFVLGGVASAAAVVLLVRRPVTHEVVAPASSRIVTANAATHVSIGELGLDVAAHSSLEVSGDDERGRLVFLDRGAVTCEVAPRRGRPPFAV